MNKQYLAVQVGNGTATHIGFEFITANGAKVLSVGCGSRRMGTQKRVIGNVDLATYTDNARHCAKCAERYAEKVGA